MNDAGRIGFVIRGEYDAAAAYDFLDVVYFENGSYVAKKLTTGNPPEENGEYWQILTKASDKVVFGVKGDGESEYRDGYVNLTSVNIGAAPTSHASSDTTYGASTASNYGHAMASTTTPKANGTAAVGSETAKFARGDHVHPMQTQDGAGNIITSTYAKKSIYGDNDMSMGRRSGTTVGYHSFAFGNNLGSTNHYSFAEGEYTSANGRASHSENYNTIASGKYSHAEGNQTTASSEASHAEGVYTFADNFASHVCGKFSKYMTVGGADTTQVGDVFVIGNGTGVSSQSNALRVTYKGDVMGTKAFQSSGADYAEFIKPWADGNEDGEDRVGYFAAVRNGLLYKANEGDYIAGITSGNPSIIGNADEDYYWRYERDEFNRIVMEDVLETVQKTDDEGNLVFDEETHKPVMIETGNIIPDARMKLSKDYDSSLQADYIERKDRKEWDYVGMLGVLPVRDDGTCIPGHYCKCGQGGIATFAAERGFDTYLVIERISENVVSVILK